MKSDFSIKKKTENPPQKKTILSDESLKLPQEVCD